MQGEYREKIINDFKKKKKLYLLLFIILFLGIFLRLNDAYEEGYWNDDSSTIPTGLRFFYPHDEYPGLLTQGEPALGNYIIGKACMMSGEDFSNVTKVQKNFFVGRDALLGEQMTNATAHCHSPLYLFSTIFLIVITLLALLMLGIRSALFVAAFYALSPFLLIYSRWLHVDVIMYGFISIALLFLWLGYEVKKDGPKEKLFWVLAFIFFGFAFATKLPSALFFGFGMLMILQKYWHEALGLLSSLLHQLDLNIIKKKETNSRYVSSFIWSVVYAVGAFILAIYPPFEFKLSNLFAVMNQYKSFYPDIGSFAFSTGVIKSIKGLLYTMNVFDTFLIIIGLLIFIKLLFKRKKTKGETFVLMLTSFTFVFMFFSFAFSLLRVFFIFIVGFIFMIALLFSEKQYIFKNIKKRNKILLTFLIIYVIFQFTISFNSSPYFSTKNHLLCALSDNHLCDLTSQKVGMTAKIRAEFLEGRLLENETYFSDDPVMYYYIRQGQSYDHYYFREAFRQQFGRTPTIEEYIQNLKPMGKTIRYVLLFSLEGTEEDINAFRNTYVPNYRLKAGDDEVVFVYDIKNLMKIN